MRQRHHLIEEVNNNSCVCVIVYVLTDRMKKWVREKERESKQEREITKHKTAERQKTSTMLGLFHVAFFSPFGKR